MEGRGFDRQVALDFSCGYAPGGWDTLTRHLRGLGYTQEELLGRARLILSAAHDAGKTSWAN